MWQGANKRAAAVKSTDRERTPLNKNSSDGIIESASALKMLLFFKANGPNNAIKRYQHGV